jgi:hypothetical protein
MQASVEIRKKLALLVGNLLSRCIREARFIPHVLTREEVISILLKNPALYEKLVSDEHAESSQTSKDDLTIKIDVAKELEKLDSLDALEASFWDGPEVDLSPILDSTNQLTRTFAVYLGNAATLFDRAFENFMNRFRQSVQRAGMTLKTVDFASDDVAVLEANAVSHLCSSEFLQAFTFDRLLSSQVMMKQVINLPVEKYSMRENLIQHALHDPNLEPALIKFVLRISYVSQGAWDDLVSILARQIHEQPGFCSPSRLLDLIEQDVVFSCNLLCRSYGEIREWSANQRREAIASSLRNYQDRLSIKAASQGP